MIKVKVKNLKQLKRAFRKAPSVSVKEVNDAIKKSIFTIEGRSKEVTPVDTGRLRASISKGKQFKSLYGSIGPRTDYAIYVHRDRPFMKWGLEASENPIERYFQKAGDNIVKFIARKSK